MKKPIIIAALILLLSAFRSGQHETQPIETVKPNDNIIQLALLLDVSGSMGGLINQAKSELWNIVSEVAKARKSGQNTKLEIALYEYGRSGANAKTGYVTRLLDYTSDLDTISKVLFALNTNGGEEYCGTVINNALEELQWRENPNIYRVIFIAGNEPFNQGQLPYAEPCGKSIGRGIIINTIHCGDSMTGVREFWADGAKVGGGEYFFINHNQFSDIVTPFDSVIMSFNSSLNTTYWSYGDAGAVYKTNMLEQDSNAGKYSEKAKVGRALAKNTLMYDNAKWDMIDAYRADSNFLEKTKDEDLPDNMKGLSTERKKFMLDSLTAARERINDQVNELRIKREKFIRENEKQSGQRSLGQALVEAIHRQATQKGFVFVE